MRWGLLGAGAVSRQFARSVQLLPDHRLVAVASRSRDRAEAFRQELKVERAYDRYEALAEADDVDAVYVATPATLHRTHACMMLAGGKPVLCEKPFAATVTDAQAIADQARASGVFCMEAMWMRFIPAIRAVRDEIRSGTIGDVRLVQAELGFAQPFDPTGRHYDPDLGGGALLDLGVYPLSLAWFLLGAPQQGYALSTPAPTGVDEQTVMVLEHAHGALSKLGCTFTQRARNSAFIIGTHGTIAIEAPIFSPSTFTVTHAPPPTSSPAGGAGGRWSAVGRFIEGRPELVQLRRSYAPVLRKLIRRQSQTRTLSFAGFGYQFEAEEVARCVRAGALESPDMPLDETLAIQRAMEQLATAGRLEAP